jgi:hypothetical protein
MKLTTLLAIVVAAIGCSQSSSSHLGHEDSPKLVAHSASTAPQPVATSKAVIGLVRDRSQASALIGQLQRGGFSNDHIAALLFDRKSTREFAQAQNTAKPDPPAEPSDVREPAALPAAPTKDGALAIPNLEPLGVVGPVVAVLSGAAVSGGEIRRSLIEMKIPESELARYEAKIRGGSVLIAARSDDDAERARARGIFESVGAFDTETVGGES